MEKVLSIFIRVLVFASGNRIEYLYENFGKSINY